MAAHVEDDVHGLGWYLAPMHASDRLPGDTDVPPTAQHGLADLKDRDAVDGPLHEARIVGAPLDSVLDTGMMDTNKPCPAFYRLRVPSVKTRVTDIASFPCF